jgi:hypothetical protein
MKNCLKEAEKRTWAGNLGQAPLVGSLSSIVFSSETGIGQSINEVF